MTTAHPGPDPDDRHRAVREQLGAYALGALPPDEQQTVDEHLDHCAGCSASLDELRPLAAPLAALDPDDLGTGVAEEADGDPSPGGFVAIRARIRAEAAADPPTMRTSTPLDPPTVRGVLLPPIDPPTVRLAGPATQPDDTPRPGRGPATVVTMPRRGFRLRLAAAAAAVAVVAGGLGALVGAGGVGAGADGDPVSVQALVPGVNASAGIVPHTWGVEVKLAATGFEPGRVYRASVLDRTGRPVSAGEFVGTGSSEMRCNLNSSVLADQATGFVVTDTAGNQVLRSGTI